MRTLAAVHERVLNDWRVTREAFEIFEKQFLGFPEALVETLAKDEESEKRAFATLAAALTTESAEFVKMAKGTLRKRKKNSRKKK